MYKLSELTKFQVYNGDRNLLRLSVRRELALPGSCTGIRQWLQKWVLDSRWFVTVMILAKLAIPITMLMKMMIKIIIWIITDETPIQALCWIHSHFLLLPSSPPDAIHIVLSPGCFQLHKEKLRFILCVPCNPSVI